MSIRGISFNLFAPSFSLRSRPDPWPWTAAQAKALIFSAS